MTLTPELNLCPRSTLDKEDAGTWIFGRSFYLINACSKGGGTRVIFGKRSNGSSLSPGRHRVVVGNLMISVDSGRQGECIDFPVCNPGEADRRSRSERIRMKKVRVLNVFYDGTDFILLRLRRRCV